MIVFLKRPPDEENNDMDVFGVVAESKQNIMSLDPAEINPTFENIPMEKFQSEGRIVRKEKHLADFYWYDEAQLDQAKEIFSQSFGIS